MLLKNFPIAMFILIFIISIYSIKAQEILWEKEYSIDTINTTMIWSGNEIHKYIYETPNKELHYIH